MMMSKSQPRLQQHLNRQKAIISTLLQNQPAARRTGIRPPLYSLIAKCKGGWAGKRKGKGKENGAPGTPLPKGSAKRPQG